MPDSDNRSLTVPKFSSFKPKPAEAQLLLPCSTSHASESRNEGSHHSSHDDVRKRKRSSRDHPEHRRRRHHSRSPLDESKALVEVDRPSPRSVEPNQDESLFIIDKRGDALISRFHTNDRGKIPTYRRGGRGRVLGSNGFLSFHRDGNREEFSIRMPGEGPSVLRDRHLFNATIRRIKPRRIKPLADSKSLPGNTEQGEEEDFVPLRASSQNQLVVRDEPVDDDGPTYRSIEGKAKAHAHSDSELDYSSDDDETRVDVDDPIRQKSIHLSRYVKEHPEDISAWLELIHHQDVLLRAGEAYDSEATKAEVHSYAEIKFSMYEKAIGHAKNAHDEEGLLLGMMTEGAKTWSATKLERRWEEVSKKHPSSFSLWRARLDFGMSNISSFQFQAVKEIHVRRLQDLPQHKVWSAPRAGVPLTEDVTALYEQQIYVFLRLTRFVFASGYRELAVAAWQAMLELSLQRPSNLEHASAQHVLDAFQDFWENEAPRMGEKDCLGWAQSLQNDADIDPPEPATDNNEVSQSRDVFKAWGLTEARRAVGARCPARALDETDDNDPFRVVMYSDLKEFIFVIPSQIIPVVAGQLLDSYLLFCQLPAAVGSSLWIKHAKTDPYIVGDLSGLDQAIRQNLKQPALDESVQSQLPDFCHNGTHEAVDLSLLFASSGWFKYLQGWATRTPDHGGPVSLDTTVRTLRLLVRSSRFVEFADYLLALEWALNKSDIKKRAKALLKQFPANRQLYAAYASAEWGNGNAEVARQVLTLATTLPEAEQNQGETNLILRLTRAWMELDIGDKARAVQALSASAINSSQDVLRVYQHSPDRVLTAVDILASRVKHSISVTKYNDAVLQAEALVLLEYLTTARGTESTSISQGNISAAMSRIWAVSQEFGRSGVATNSAQERLLQTGARLMYHHASHGPFRSAYLREQLAKCIRKFPQNPIFHSLFAWASPTFGIDDPTKDVLRNVILTDANDCLDSRTFAIRYELRKGNSHSARAAFEHALDSPVCKSNPDLWRCYIKLCYARPELRSKAKDVLLRALGHCPWSKDLAMEAFTTLINVMDEFELRSVYDTLTSKGHRVHLDLNEFIKAHGRGTTSR